MPTVVPNEDSHGKFKASVAGFPWAKVIALSLDDYEYSTELSISEARLLAGALYEQIARLDVIGSTDLEPSEFVD